MPTMLPTIDFSKIDFSQYVSTVPKTFGMENFSQNWIEQNVIKGKQLLMFPLKELVELYFPDRKLDELASHRHNLGEKTKDTTIDNCSFLVVIGVKKSYEEMFQKTNSTSNNKAHSTKNIYLTSIPSKINRTYKDVFRDFFASMFRGDESEYLEESYENENMVTISIFARNASLTKGKALLRISDSVIAASSFVYDSHDSLLLSWIGVIAKSLAEVRVHDNFSNSNNTIRSSYNVGKFLLVISQIFKSILQQKWCPIVCQVHGVRDQGPYEWYIKNYFIQVPDTFQLVYDQSLHRNDYVIYNDKDLIY
jgi:hypothetical protein